MNKICEIQSLESKQSFRMFVSRLLLGLWVVDIALGCTPTEAESCLTSPQAITHNATGDDIEWETIDTNTYHTTIVYDATTVCWYQTNPLFNTQVTTKLFNNSLPSQTIRMQRGKQYQITIVNNLGPESEFNPPTKLDDGSHNNVERVIFHSISLSMHISVDMTVN